MKTKKNFGFSLFLVLFSLLILYSCGIKKKLNTDNSYRIEIVNFQNQLNKEFSNKETSPLDSIDLLQFKKLDFFPIDKKYSIWAGFKKNEHPTPFKFPTNTKRTPIYIVYGVATFKINGQKFDLNIYQNLENLNDSIYKDYLFLPFADETNGFETYGGGRYIDLHIPKDSTKIIIDFNKAYNPYCAYSHRWSCPLVPIKNHLPIEIKAGVKKFSSHE